MALARCFLRKPKLLFLDEATSALDAENEALVQEGIDRLLETCKCTVLLIAHRLSTVMNADQIAVINGGKIVELGTHDVRTWTQPYPIPTLPLSPPLGTHSLRPARCSLPPSTLSRTAGVSTVGQRGTPAKTGRNESNRPRVGGAG